LIEEINPNEINKKRLTSFSESAAKTILDNVNRWLIK